MESESSIDKSGQTSESEYGISVLASTFAHEIRNPLQSIRLQIDAGLRGNNSTETLHNISRGVDRIERLLEKIQGYSQRYKLDVEPVNLKDVLNAVVGSVRYWLNASGISITEHIQWEGQPIVECDRELTEQVLLNLVSNAIQSMERGGSLRVNILECQSEAQIEVRDSGCGMDKDTLAKVGTPFFTTKASGNGLGLAFCRSIAALHGGSLTLESVQGQGTIVTLKVPKQVLQA
ncbi:MAG: hypothetical protein COV44_07730 [Deltaproteobacteria bacterium CG11_big_fil_rev_8_21_14_0_20_45_16]|nr:MAG: hypothetical protein COV44_07730 [Deltaproteobacteria bacterium CG11_big_fil_rev_8_21_14_0_20_45_16]